MPFVISEDESRITDRCKFMVEDRLWKETVWIFENMKGLEPQDISCWTGPYMCSNCFGETFYDRKHGADKKRICSVCESLLSDINSTSNDMKSILRVLHDVIEGRQPWRGVFCTRRKVLSKRKNKLENFYKVRKSSAAILTLLNHHILPKDIVRTTKSFLY